MADDKKLTLNEKIALIEENAKKLEDNTLGLEESMKLYEESLNLIKECNVELDQAKNKIFKLSPDNIEIEVDENLEEVNEL